MACNIGIMLFASAKMFHTLFGWNELVSILVTAGLVGCYTSVGGLAASIIHLKALKKKWKKTALVLRGIRWLEKDFDIAKQPGTKDNRRWHMNWLFSLERLFALLEKDEFGGKDWWKDGVDRLFKLRGGDGAWFLQANWQLATCGDTCMAILFFCRE